MEDWQKTLAALKKEYGDAKDIITWHEPYMRRLAELQVLTSMAVLREVGRLGDLMEEGQGGE